MLAKQCDRCGTFYEHYGTQDIKKEGLKFNGIKTMVFDKYCDDATIYKDYDLCKQCSKLLQMFLSNKVGIISYDVSSEIGDDTDALPGV